MMDSHNIQACVLSLSAPGLDFASPDLAMNLARTINIQFAEIIRDHPTRFGAFALLPLPNVEAALQEIAYALDVLKLDGVGLFTNYEGVYLGDLKFAPILDELHRRKAVVFVHPTKPPCSDKLTLGYPAPMLEYPFDTTRMVLSLLDTDTLDRCNHIRFIICHGGGALPLLIHRIAPLMAVKTGGNKISTLINMMTVRPHSRYQRLLSWTAQRGSRTFEAADGLRFSVYATYLDKPGQEGSRSIRQVFGKRENFDRPRERERAFP
jgi:predicted TIM-barrel fold metal-dependent hydrolase